MEWRQKRYGLSNAKPFSYKLRRAYEIVAKNKLSFVALLLAYFTAQTIGNAGLLVLQWTIDKDSPRTSYLILVQLTANWPVRLWRALLNCCVLHVVLQALKRRGNELILSDVLGVRAIMSWKLLIAIFLTDMVLSSPLAISQALLYTDLVWAVIYMIFGFILNWLFGMTQILLFEDPSLSIGSCFVWSAAAALSPYAFSCVLMSCLFIFVTMPLVVTTPFLLVLQLLTFFEVFGFSSPVEVHYTVEAN